MIEVLVSMGVIGGIGAILAVVLELADRYIANYGECRMPAHSSPCWMSRASASTPSATPMPA